MATFPVKHTHSNMRGAPVLGGFAGSGIAMLDACLITGFGTTTALSVVVASGIATATLTSGQTFDKNCIVLVSGATPGELNGEALVLTSNLTSITWATTAADGAATGTITIKVAPVGGWEKLYTGTNKAVYRSTDPLALGFCLRVDDSNATDMRVVGYESMSDVDTGTGPFPTSVQISGGGYWVKSAAANATAVRWDVFGDSRTFYPCIAPSSGGNAAHIGVSARGFGDMIALKPGSDGYACALSCSNVGGVPAAYTNSGFDRTDSGSNAVYLPRNLSGLGSSVFPGTAAYVGAAGSVASGVDGTLGVFPSDVDGELKISARFIKNSGSGAPRADIPGIFYIPQSGVVAAGLGARDRVTGSGGIAARNLVVMLTNKREEGTGSVPLAAFLIDVTGPWRP